MEGSESFTANLGEENEQLVYGLSPLRVTTLKGSQAAFSIKVISDEKITFSATS